MNPAQSLIWLAGGVFIVIAGIFVVRVLTKTGLGEDEDVGISIYVLVSSIGLGIYTASFLLTSFLLTFFFLWSCR